MFISAFGPPAAPSGALELVTNVTGTLIGLPRRRAPFRFLPAFRFTDSVHVGSLLLPQRVTVKLAVPVFLAAGDIAFALVHQPLIRIVRMIWR